MRRVFSILRQAQDERSPLIRGQALVELALMMPMLVGVVALLFQLGILSAHRVMRVHGREPSQALVEFSLAAPLLMIFVLAVIQLSLVFVWFYSETSVARDAARWLAVHPNTSDDAMALQVQRSRVAQRHMSGRGCARMAPDCSCR